VEEDDKGRDDDDEEANDGILFEKEFPLFSIHFYFRFLKSRFRCNLCMTQISCSGRFTSD